jgi:hypothetical protein
MCRRWWYLIVLSLSLSMTVFGATPGTLPPAVDQQLARSLFKELVEIRTTHDQGSTEAARAIQKHLLQASFPESDVVFIAPPDHPTKGNVVVRYRGKSLAKPVLFSVIWTSWNSATYPRRNSRMM